MFNNQSYLKTKGLCAAFLFASLQLLSAPVQHAQVSVNDANGMFLGAVFSTNILLEAGTTYSTVTAPAIYVSTNRFTHWTSDRSPGAQFRDPWGRSLNPMTFVLLAATTNTAHYLPATRDTDADGIPDWYEIEYFNTLAYNGADDADNDGLSLATEVANGSHPLFGNSISLGRVYWTNSSLTTVNLAGYPSYVIRSSPTGTVYQSGIVAPGTVVTTPERPGGTTFGQWTLDGIRQQDAFGVAVTKIAFQLTTTNREAIAYLFSGDTDADSVPDAYEYFYYGTLSNGATSDTDNDGKTLLQEYTAGTPPHIGNTVSEGGVAYVDSGLMTYDLRGYSYYTIRSNPTGTLHQTALVLDGTTVTTPEMTQETFGYWTLDGVQQRDPWGLPLRRISFLVDGVDREAVAHLFMGDTDEDGVPDAYEQAYYGTLANDGSSDTDNDGRSLLQEFTDGTPPHIGNTISEGGVYWADSETIAVDLAPIMRGVCFEQAAIEALEGSLGINRIAEIPVFAVGPATVTIHAIPGTATTADYIWPTSPTTLTWATGVAETKMVRVPIKTDSLFEPDEVFYLMIGAPNSGRQLGEQRICAVTIKDVTRGDKLGDALDNLVLSWSTGGTPSWTPQSDVTFDGEDAAWSGPLGSNKISYVQTSVAGTGTVSFSWCVIGNGTLRLLEGTRVLLAITNTTEWATQSVYLPNNVTHALKWEYKQGSDGAGRAYLDRVVWLPGGKKAVQVTVNADSPEGGVASGSGTYISGAKIVLNAKARSGWLFTGWTSDVPLANPLMAAQTLTVGNSDQVLTAHFEKIPVVTGLPNPPEGGNVAGTGLCLPGKSVILTATPAAGWALTRWSDGVQTLSRTISTATDRTLYAEFKRIADVTPPAIGGIESQRAMVGVPFEVRFEMTSEALATLTITGLPSGLSFNPAAQVISGVPTVSVTNREVVITARSASVQPSTRTFLLTVDPLPVWAQGVFNGLLDSDAMGSGPATLSITSLGAMSGKFTLRGTNGLFSAPAYAGRGEDGSFLLIATAKVGTASWPLNLVVSLPEQTDPEGVVPDTLSRADGLVVGRTEELMLYRHVWNEPGMRTFLTNNVTGYYTVSLPGGSQYGSGYLTLTVNKDGLVKTAGKLADGTALSLSSTLLLDEAGRVFTVLYTAPSAYKGGGFFALAEFVRSESGAVCVQCYQAVPCQWVSMSPVATEVYGAGFTRALGLVGGRYDTLGNLYRYYQGQPLTVGTAEGAPVPELLVGTNRYDAAYWDPSGLTVTVVTNAAGVMTGLAAPRAWTPVKAEGVYAYGSGTNAVGLTIGLTRATGVMKGSFKAWFDYGTSHTYKTIKYEGVLTPEKVDATDPVAGRGFFLWSDKALSPLSPYPYSFKGSYDIRLLLDE